MEYRKQGVLAELLLNYTHAQYYENRVPNKKGFHPMPQGKIERCHESLDNLTPSDVYSGRGQTILEHRAQIKQKTIGLRRKLHQLSAA